MASDEINRREFIGLSAAGVAGSVLGLRPAAADATQQESWDPTAPMVVTGKALRVQPILMYRVAQRREATSWKSWGGVQDDQAAEKERWRLRVEEMWQARRSGRPGE